MKKLLSLLLVLVLSLTLLSACGSSDDADEATTTTKASSDEGSAGSDITEKTVITVAVDDAYPPMEYIDDNGDLVGFDIDFMTALSEEIGMEVEFLSTPWDSIFIGLVAGKYDVIVSSVSITEDRLANYDVSSPYLSNGQVIIVPVDGEDIATPEGLGGLTVGVQIDTTSDHSASKVQETVDFELEAYDQIIETFLDLKAGRLDAIVVDFMVAMEYMKNEPGLYKITSAQLTNEPIAVYFKQDSNTELLETINAGIKTLLENGKLKEISIKWFGEDYTSDINTDLW